MRMNSARLWTARTAWLWLAALAVGLSAVGPALARDLYVNNVTGDDRRDGSQPESDGKLGGPFRTLTRALKAASKADRIIVAATGEPYRESITIQAGNHSGITGRPFTIVGNGAVLDGSQSVPGSVWEHVQGDIFRFLPPRMAHQILYLDGKPAKRVPAERLGPLPPLEPLQWCLVDRHIYFRTENGQVPAAYNLAYAALPVGITVYESRLVEIQNLVVQGFQLDGVNAHDGVFDLALIGLVCRGNGRSGISVGGASRVRIEACLVGSNGEAQLRTEGLSRTRLINSDLVDDDPAAPAVVRESGEVVVEQPPGPLPAANDS